MKTAKILVIWTSILTFVSPSYQQQCYRRCNCLQRISQMNRCIYDTTDLNLYLDTKEISFYCKKMISKNTDNVQTFDASYLSIIDDKSPITLESMIKKCHKTKEKIIRYEVDFHKLHNISSTDIIFDNKNIVIKNLQIQGTTQTHKRINISIMGSQFGSNIEKLIVKNITVPDLKSYLENIPKIETIVFISNRINYFPDKAFSNLRKLRSLSINDNGVKTLNQSMFDGLRNITLLDLSDNLIEDLENTTFSTLDELNYLNLSNNNLGIIKTNTFASMSMLNHLDLSKNKNLTLPENVFQELSSLRSLNLSECGITYIPENMFQRCENLEILNLSRNNILKLENNTFQNLSSLTILDLSHNKLETLSSALLHLLKNLQHIYLESNKLTIFSSEVFWNINALKTIDLSNNLINKFHKSLGAFTANTIILNNNNITRFPSFLLYVVVNLNYLDLSGNRISSVELIKDLIPKTWNMTLDLSNNLIKEINITSTEIVPKAIMNKNWNIILNLSKNYLQCNCEIFKLQQVSEVKTNSILEVKNEATVCLNQAKFPQCPLIPIKNCPEKCLCYFREIDKAIVANCSFGNLTKFPTIVDLKSMHSSYKHNKTIVVLKGNKLDQDGQERLESYGNVTSLDLSSNEIRHLKWVPKKLVDINLENNRLTTLSQEVVGALEKNTNLKWITLNDNPWICDCKANYLQKYLREYNNLKVDPSGIICQKTKEKLLHAEICQPSPGFLKIGLPVGLTTILAIISVLLALYFKYSTSIKIYLYSKNLCLWFVAEEEIDKEKTFDIFISYSHKDETFVQSELLPGLENNETPFKVCIHYRDWIPGEFISKQIISSVLDSRRTLVVLSNNFMESVWGKMEFRTAHMQAINEGRARVIVVIYEDLDENVLDDEMKAYLKTNTYVKWGDPWFWNKLKYALPHSKHRSNIVTHQSLESFHLK